MSRCICLDTILFVCFNEHHRCICPKGHHLYSCKADIHNDSPDYPTHRKYLSLNKLLTECFCKKLDQLKFKWCEYLHPHNCICESLIKNGFGTESCNAQLKTHKHFCVCLHISDINHEKCRARNTKHYTHTC